MSNNLIKGPFPQCISGPATFFLADNRKCRNKYSVVRSDELA